VASAISKALQRGLIRLPSGVPRRKPGSSGAIANDGEESDSITRALARDGDVVERKHLIPHDLPLLMSLAGEQDDVVGTGFFDGGSDGLAPAGDFARARRSGEDVATDRGRVFAARIVVRDDRKIGHAGGDGAHLRSLADIAVAASAEDSDQPPLGVRAKRLDRAFQRVLGMGIVDIDRCAGARDNRPLEPPSNRLDSREIVERLLELPPVAITRAAAVSTFAA
jgi:hypothetical protein